MRYRVLRNKSYFFYIIAQALSKVGDGLYTIAIMWLLLKISGGSGLAVGINSTFGCFFPESLIISLSISSVSILDSPANYFSTTNCNDFHNFPSKFFIIFCFNFIKTINLVDALSDFNFDLR